MFQFWNHFVLSRCCHLLLQLFVVKQIYTTWTIENSGCYRKWFIMFLVLQQRERSVCILMQSLSSKFVDFGFILCIRRFKIHLKIPEELHSFIFRRSLRDFRGHTRNTGAWGDGQVSVVSCVVRCHFCCHGDCSGGSPAVLWRKETESESCFTQAKESCKQRLQFSLKAGSIDASS